MPKGKAPSFQFYPDDWISDAELAICSIGAQGLWIYMLCIMHKSPKPGYLLLANGERFPEERLRLIRNIPEEIFSMLLSELETAGVFSRNDDGVIYSRRMVRDVYNRKEWRKRQKKHRVTDNSVTHNVTHVSRLSSSSSSSSSSSTKQEPKTIAAQPAAYTPEFENFWKSYPEARKVGKRDAFTYWKRDAKSSETILRIMDGLTRWKSSQQWLDPQFIPYPQKFLNKRRWEDVPESGGGTHVPESKHGLLEQVRLKAVRSLEQVSG